MESQESRILISPKPFREFTESEYHDYVRGLYHKPVDKNAAPVTGLSVSRTKKGKLSVRKSKDLRAFDYVLESELELMAPHYGIELGELREAFSARKFIITKTRLDAEREYQKRKKA